MSEELDIAVVGATGVVGEALLEYPEPTKISCRQSVCTCERALGWQETSVLATANLQVEDLAEFDFSKCANRLFSAGGSISEEFAPKAAAAGCVVVDNTSQFRYDDDIPLVVPEVNPEAIADYTVPRHHREPKLFDDSDGCGAKADLRRSRDRAHQCRTYQAVSGAGRSAVERTGSGQTRVLLNGRPLEIEGDAKQIAFNAVPHIDVFQDNRYTKEEMKMVWETQKILGDDSIRVNPTAVRIPVFYGHSEAIHIETRDKISAAAACELLSKAPGVQVLDGVETGQYPTAVTESSGAGSGFRRPNSRRYLA